MPRSENSPNPLDQVYVRLLGTAMQRASSVLGVTSARRKEGTTTLALGLARAAQRAGAGRTLVVDAAPRGKRVARYLGIRCPLLEEPEALARGGSERDRLIAHDARSKLDVLTLPDHRLSCLLPEHWTPAMAALRDVYPCIVVDLADLQTPVPGAWQSRMDELTLVVDTTRATVESLGRLRKDLANSGLRPSGFVLNKRRFYVPSLFYRIVY